MSRTVTRLGLVLATAVALGSGGAMAGDKEDGGKKNSACRGLPGHGELTAALAKHVATTADPATTNGGLDNNMWASIVSRDGTVCTVTRTGDDLNDQWLGSRVISAQKANTANAFSLRQGSGGADGLALSTANLYSPVQPGGSLFGLQFANPVDPDVAYKGNAHKFGSSNDPMVGRRVGGTNVFGGGLALYDKSGELIGGLGVSGDTSCADHNVAWRVRDELELHTVPAGVSAASDDFIIFDIDETGTSKSGFGHPFCLNPETEATIAERIHTAFPVERPTE